MTRAYRLLTRWWTAFALAASLAMLGVAHAFEQFGGLEPCNLCLKQREVFWGAAVIGLLATGWTLISGGRRGTPRIASFLLAAVFLTGTIAAAFHAGGEYGWWRLPAACAAGGLKFLAERWNTRLPCRSPTAARTSAKSGARDSSRT